MNSGNAFAEIIMSLEGMKAGAPERESEGIRSEAGN